WWRSGQAGTRDELQPAGRKLSGVSILTTTLEPKRVGLLRELVPGTIMIGVLADPGFTLYESQLRDVQEAALALALQALVLPASTDRDIEGAFITVVQRRIPALTVLAAPFLDTRRDMLVALAARHAVPTMYQFREFVTAGGLLSYGVNVADAYRQVGLYAAR